MNPRKRVYRIGTAGWTVPKRFSPEFPGEGAHLQRYARIFNAAEINSTFSRTHKPQTFIRWAESVPDGFCFSVKLAKEITHMRKLVGATRLFKRFVAEVNALGDRLGPMLVQLPPSLAFTKKTNGFFAMARDSFQGPLACEPRHLSWFEDEANALFKKFDVARVAADPPRSEEGARPGGAERLTYRRLHGAPRVYYSAYPPSVIKSIAAQMKQAPAFLRESWCVFDNTVLGEATGNALELKNLLLSSPSTGDRPD
jgi:uncharacterized protein YecE (DUF72 family)